MFWTAIIPAVAKWLPTGILQPILSYLEKKADSKTERTRLYLNEIIETRKVKRDILVAEQANWWTSMIRPLMAAPIIIYMWKVVVWDKVLGLGVTDPLTGSIGEWAGAIVAAYFIARPVEKGAAAVARAIAQRYK